jgi:hypothetical protein
MGHALPAIMLTLVASFAGVFWFALPSLQPAEASGSSLGFFCGDSSSSSETKLMTSLAWDNASCLRLPGAGDSMATSFVAFSTR